MEGYFINPEGNLGHPVAYTHTQIHLYTSPTYIHKSHIHTHRENIFTQSVSYIPNTTSCGLYSTHTTPCGYTALTLTLPHVDYTALTLTLLHVDYTALTLTLLHVDYTALLHVDYTALLHVDYTALPHVDYLHLHLVI